MVTLQPSSPRLVAYPLSFSVTTDDIAYGVIASSEGCPVSRAMSRATGCVAAVTLGITYFFDGQRRVGRAKHLFCPSLMCWIADLDNGTAMQPAEFTLPVEWAVNAVPAHIPQSHIARANETRTNSLRTRLREAA